MNPQCVMTATSAQSDSAAIADRKAAPRGDQRLLGFRGADADMVVPPRIVEMVEAVAREQARNAVGEVPMSQWKAARSRTSGSIVTSRPRPSAMIDAVSSARRYGLAIRRRTPAPRKRLGGGGGLTPAFLGQLRIGNARIDARDRKDGVELGLAMADEDHGRRQRAKVNALAWAAS